MPSASMSNEPWPHSPRFQMNPVSSSMVTLFSSPEPVNSARGVLVLVLNYIALQLRNWGLGFWPACFAAIAVSFVSGVTIERVILRPLHTAPVLSIVVVFIGLLVYGLFIWGSAVVDATAGAREIALGGEPSPKLRYFHL